MICKCLGGSMKIRIFCFFTVAISTAMVGCSRKPKSHKDQVSYTIGAQFGKSLKAQDLDLDSTSLAHGIEDGLKAPKLAMSDEEMQAAMMKLNEERQATMRVAAEKHKAESEAF